MEFSTSRPKYIHLEGMDLAGKTSAARGLVQRLPGQWAIRRNTLSDQNPIYDTADKLRRADRFDAEVLGNLYVAALLADIRSFRWPTQNTIQDSTILLRSYAHHSAWSTPRIAAAFRDLAVDHPSFDVSFVLTASLDCRLARLEKRRSNEPDQLAPDDLLIERDPQAFLSMETCLIELAVTAFRATVIDTSNLTAEEVLDLMVTTLYAVNNI